jgi:hypothetical protein
VSCLDDEVFSPAVTAWLVSPLVEAEVGEQVIMTRGSPTVSDVLSLRYSRRLDPVSPSSFGPATHLPRQAPRTLRRSINRTGRLLTGSKGGSASGPDGRTLVMQVRAEKMTRPRRSTTCPH